MKRNCVFMVLLTLILTARSSPTIANNNPYWGPCYPYRIYNPDFPWNHPGSDRINVYYDSASFQNILGMSDYDIRLAISETTAILNEQMGSNLFLYFTGLPAPNDYKGILVRAYDGSCTAALAGVNVPPLPSPNYTAASIDVQKQVGDVVSCFHPPIVWKFYQESEAVPGQHDVVTVLLHEFAHAVGGYYHPGDANSPCPLLPNSPDPSVQNTILDSNGVWTNLVWGGRIVRIFDKRRWRDQFLPRWGESSLRYFKWTGNDSWVGPYVGLDQLSYVSHRPAVSQGGTNVLFAWNAFSYNPGSGVHTALWDPSVGLGLFSTHNDPGTNAERHANAEMPPAVARSTTGSEAIVVYFSRNPSLNAYEPTADLSDICYRLSADGGTTWGGETCTGQMNKRYGLGVTHDPVSNRWIVSFASHFNEKLYFFTLPIGGGAPVFSSFTNTNAWEGATMACRNAYMGCRMAYRDLTYGVRVISGRVGTGGVFVASTNVVVGAISNDQPSIAWNPADSTYRLAFKQGSTSIWSSSSPAATNTWSTPTIRYSNPNYMISAPVLASTSTGLYLWYARWNN